MIEMSLMKLCCAMLAAMLAGANIGFLAAAIFANSKYRDMQADEISRVKT